ncbi:LrgA-associated membrane protein LrgB [Klebsiella variicola]|uniref:LrgA-associated membrane protein LrgB n=1 Tax=Klebsiella variicola TaxID=244366 RepID=A0A7H4MNZ2_KLEVA|nr:LrgA-associated membrane protein LrgB [Klebsiella variicola]
MMHEIWWSLPLTLIVFFLARRLAARFKFPLLNPLLGGDGSYNSVSAADRDLL